MKPTNVAIDDPTSLRSTWSHRAWVASGFASVLTSLAKSAVAAADAGSVFEPLLAAYAGYVLADLASGVFHWAVDNYGGPSTPVFGSQIEAFQGHHRWPWTITRREFANNLHALARAVTFSVLPIEALLDGMEGGAAAHAFVGTCAGCVMLSQQFHAWAHEKARRVPRAVAALQEAGVLVSRQMHGAHHRPPYKTNYCIVSGAWNGVLDEYKVFEAMEMILFFRFGVRPRSWSEPRPEWREEEEEEKAEEESGP